MQQSGSPHSPRFLTELLPFAFCVAVLLPSVCPNFLSSSSGSPHLLANAPQHKVHLFSVLLL